MPKPCVVCHPHHGQSIPAIHKRGAGKKRFLHFVASGHLGKAEAVTGVLRTAGRKATKGKTKSKAKDKFWVIQFYLEDPKPKTLYDLEILDKRGKVLAVCKNLQFTVGTNSLTVTSPSDQSVCPTFIAYGTSTSQSPINGAGCLIGGQAANVTIVQNTDSNGAWTVQFNGCALTAPNTTSITVAQKDGTSGGSGGLTVIGCVGPPPPPSP
jgi:hypothetical protein